jgi:hypothetical protein
MPTKGVADRAYALVIQWRGQGVPEFITAYEAYNLTGGAVGREYGKTGATKEMNLAQVAMKATKAGVK